MVNVFFRDKKGQTPYGVAAEKDTRNTFRKYMAEHPHKYDYIKAQVDKSILWRLAAPQIVTKYSFAWRPQIKMILIFTLKTK